jgi:adhesin transport system membrane fusion protein
LRTEKNFLGTDDKPLPIIPGMTATAEILTGHKTVLDYLLKPILKVRDRALRER